MGPKYLPAGSFAPVQGFAPSKIQTFAAATPTSVSDYLAIRTTEAGEYYINSDSGNKATVAAGVLIVIADDVTTLTFTASTICEVMTK